MERVGHLIIDLKNALSRNNVSHLNYSVITLAIEHVIGSKNEFGDEACGALKNAINTVIENANGIVSTHDANKRLETLAKKISANRGFLRAVVSDTLDFIGPIGTGIAGITSSIIIKWNWMNFISSMSAFQALALTPAGMVATTGAVMSWKTFTPEGGFTFLDYIKFGLGDREIWYNLLPSLEKLIDILPARQDVVKISSWGNVFNSAVTIVNNLLGGYIYDSEKIFIADVRHTYDQMGRQLDRASGSVRAVTHVMYGWICVFLFIFVIFFFIHAKSSLIGFLSRSSSDPSGAHPYNASSRHAPSRPAIRLLEDGEKLSEDSGFRSKRSNKKKKSVKRSAKKRSSKTTIKRTKKSTRR